MERITKRDLTTQIHMLNKITGADYDFDWAYGGVKVVHENGSQDVTVRGTKREIYNMLHGMLHIAYRATIPTDGESLGLPPSLHLLTRK